MADKTYKLELTLSNGTKINAGNFVAQQGAKGDKGATGEKGATGAAGAAGVSVTGATLTEVTA